MPTHLPTPLRIHPALLKTTLQVVVLGARYGRWGLETYGPAPVKVDKLEFLRRVHSYTIAICTH